ncbi:FGGY-family carbohydrate kinase [Myxacorys almedinensis]|uniref:D-ribulose kinase n=1 Tax=Myxacorys almedinensis A TaxID=2690445 RepID=A0A8J7Z6D2_9CYAN|nr:FGGY-family carbohydrate kinase [Myxacorys almedinensis]NDJ17263.1 carbohydrate kinase [Myxacorys almedinensis A]
MDCYLGVDFGTSGARAIALDPNQAIQAQVSLSFDGIAPAGNLAECWKTTLFELMARLPAPVRSHLRGMAINGTSSTVLLCDRGGQPITEPLLYNDDRGKQVLAHVAEIAPPGHTVLSATSSLAKFLWWRQHLHQFGDAHYFLHQADWLAALLHGQFGISDYHNSLKLGYDIGSLRYPDWLDLPLLPTVVNPGTAIAPILPHLADQFHIPHDCVIHAGTTDSIAAFLASQATTPGDAVTSLGSTLVLKLLSRVRIDHPHYGIYSHRLGDFWLVGGASNTGGAVLNHFFSTQELLDLSARISPETESPLEYYPLLNPGERFPINDPALPPKLEPRPRDRVKFLHGLLQSIARIEMHGYHLLESLGATPLTQILTAGGGAQNPTWTAIRAHQCCVPVHSARQTEAAFGTALLTLPSSHRAHNEGMIR